MTPRVSLIIPVKNEAGRIAECLINLKAQTLTPGEIMIVDGHSTDNTVEIAKGLNAKVFFEDDGTRAGAIEVGLRAATGDFVAFTDADCFPEPRWLELLASNFSDGIVGVGGRIVNEGDTFAQRSIDAALDTLIGSANSVQGRVFAAKRFVSSISGCNSMYRRKDLLDVGGFNTHLVTMEDTELNRRLLRRGKLLYVPDAVVHHRHGRGFRDFAQRMFQYGYGRGQSLLFGPPLLVPLLAAVLLLLSFVKPYYGLLVAAGYVAAILGSSVLVSVRQRRLRFLATVPLVYVIEHTSYVAGFWIGLVRTRLGRHRLPSSKEGIA